MRNREDTGTDASENAQKAMANLSMKNSSNHSNDGETANNNRNQGVPPKESRHSVRHQAGKRDRGPSAQRTGESAKKPATDSTKTGASKTGSSNSRKHPTTGSLNPAKPFADSSSDSRKHPTSSSSKPSRRFITTSGSIIHPTFGALSLSEPSPGSRPDPIESLAASSSNSTSASNSPSPSPTSAPTYNRYPKPSSSKPTKPHTTSASTAKPTNPPPVDASSSNSISAPESRSKPEQKLYKQNANRPCHCEKGCVDKFFINADKLKRHYRERHSENKPAFTCPLGKDCTDVVFSRKENMNRHSTSKTHIEAQARHDKNKNKSK